MSLKRLLCGILLFVTVGCDNPASVSNYNSPPVNPDTVLVNWLSPSGASDLFIYANDDLTLVIFESVYRPTYDTLIVEHGSSLRSEYCTSTSKTVKTTRVVSTNQMRWMIR